MARLTSSTTRGCAVVLLLAAGLGLSCSGGGGDGPTAPPGGGGGNHNPTANLNIDKLHMAYGETAQLALVASDPDGDQVTSAWSAVKGIVTSSGPTATVASFTAGNQWGQASATATVSDGRGGSVQATVQTYIRNPLPPVFTLRPVASLQPTCDGFALEVTPSEAVIITQLLVWPDGPAGSCKLSRDISPPLSLAAGQTYVFRDPVCIRLDCGSNTISYYEIILVGTRPEPDGGSFVYDCPTWRRSSPTVCQ